MTKDKWEKNLFVLGNNISCAIKYKATVVSPKKKATHFLSVII
jgi:hypothetical protein